MKVPSKTEFKKLKDYAFDETFQKDLRMSALQAGVGEGRGGWGGND